MIAIFALGLSHHLTATRLFAGPLQSESTIQEPNFDAVPLNAEGSSYFSYKLPGDSWGLAYEPVSGRIAVTNDQAGILIFDVDELLLGKNTPRIVAVNGLPSGVCLKNFSAQTKFVVSKIDNSSLDVIDEISLARGESIRIPGATGIAKLTGGSLTQDPYLYCIAKSSSDAEAKPNDFSGQLFRVDMTNNSSCFATGKFANIFLADAGAHLFEISQSSGEYHFLRFEKNLDSPRLDTEFFYGCKRDIGREAEFDTAPGVNAGRFRRNPFVVQLRRDGSENVIEIRSTTQSHGVKGERVKRLKINLPPSATKNDLLAGRIPTTSLTTGDTGSCESWATDDRRQLFLLVKNDVLVICLLKNIGLGDPSPKLSPEKRIPRIVNIGERIQFNFDELPDGTKVGLLASASSEYINPESRSRSQRAFRSKDGGGLNDGLPVLHNNELRWIPVPQQVGWNRLRFRAVLGSQVAEWEWDVFVRTQSTALPFVAKGMSAASDSEGVVWGENHRSYGSENGVHIVAEVESKTMQVLRKIEVKETVHCATMLDDDLYVCSGDAPRLARYDLASGVKKSSVESPRLDNLKVLGGKYLMAVVNTEPNRLFFELPSLKPVEIRSGLNADLACRTSGDDTLWDGVLWDANWAPKLLLHHPKIDDPKGTLPIVRFREMPFLHLEGGPNLQQFNTNNSGNRNVSRQFLEHYPAEFAYQNGTLTAGSTLWRMGVPLNAREDSHLTSSKSHVYVTTRGRIYDVPIEQLIPNYSDLFRLERKQSSFLLNATDEVSLDYDAANAVNFRLELFSPLEGHPFWSGESSAGHFPLAFDAARLRNLVIQVTGGSQGKPDLESIRRYVQGINPFVQKLAKSKPAGISVPIRAQVTADHFDGEQKAELEHYFYVDVPGKWMVTSPETLPTNK